MANRLRGEAPLTLADGREFTVAFDFNALCEVEDAANRAIAEILGEVGRGAPRLSTARALLYGGLRTYHPEVTLAEAGDMMLTDAPRITGAMEKALSGAFPQAAGGKQGENPPRKGPGTGTRSSKSGRAKA